jgi:hypothetical protein
VLIAPCDSVGHFTMRVAITPNHMTQEHTFQFEIDQTDLAAIVRQCRAICLKYPVRCAEAKPGV